MQPILRTLSALFGLALLVTGLALRARAAEPDLVPGPVYLPLAACDSCAGGAAPTAAVPSPTSIPANPSADAAEVIRLVNIERARASCPAAVADPNLMAATQAWAEYMRANSYYQHASADWYAPYGYPTGTLENIGGGALYPYQIVEAWMASPGHRSNLLWCYPTDDPSYDPRRVYRVGVGHAGSYWVWGLVDVLP